jgi:hypothetical protein
MSTSKVALEPGWHPDPSGRHDWRYWDGEWTSHVADQPKDAPVAALPAALPGAWVEPPAPAGAPGGAVVAPAVAGAGTALLAPPASRPSGEPAPRRVASWLTGLLGARRPARATTLPAVPALAGTAGATVPAEPGPVEVEGGPARHMGVAMAPRNPGPAVRVNAPHLTMQPAVPIDFGRAVLVVVASVLIGIAPYLPWTESQFATFSFQQTGVDLHHGWYFVVGAVALGVGALACARWRVLRFPLVGLAAALLAFSIYELFEILDTIRVNNLSDTSRMTIGYGLWGLQAATAAGVMTAFGLAQRR